MVFKVKKSHHSSEKLNPDQHWGKQLDPDQQKKNADPRPCYNLNLFNLPACPPPLCPVWTHPAPPWCSCCGWERGCSWSTWRRDSLKIQQMPFFSNQTKTMICQRLFGHGCSWSTWGEIHRHFKRSYLQITRTIGQISIWQRCSWSTWSEIHWHYKRCHLQLKGKDDLSET